MFLPPISNRYFEDYVEGSVHEFGRIEVLDREVLDFTHRFEPHNILLDTRETMNVPPKGHAASGWHVGSLATRLYVDNYLSHGASLGSPGLDNLRWTKPVWPGDFLSIRVTILETHVSRSKPDRGIIRSQIEVLNQEKEVVMTMEVVNFLLRREACVHT